MYLKLTKGHNFKLPNYPEAKVLEFKDPEKVILSPLDYPFIKPKLLVQKDDAVKVGTALFFDKLNPDVKFVSSLSGKISDIVYGERRSIQSIIITNDCKYEQIDLSNKPTINSNKDSWIDFLKEHGLWSLIRQRPFSKIADSDLRPKSVFISLYDTRPYGCDPELIISSNKDLFNEGIKLLNNRGTK